MLLAKVYFWVKFYRMLRSLLFLLIFLFFSLCSAQQKFLIGTVTSDTGVRLPETTVINMRTEESVLTDEYGAFILNSLPSDEIRFLRNGFERKSIRLSQDDFTRHFNMRMIPEEQLIPEVQLGFKPTGNLKKDVRLLDRPYARKVASLNRSMGAYMQTPPSEVLPVNKMPETFTLQQAKVNNFDLIRLAGAIGGLFKKAAGPAHTAPNYAEREAFYRKVKNSLDLDYFKNMGLEDFEFDKFLAFVDIKHDLAKKFRNNFNRSEIEYLMRSEAVDYIKAKKEK